MSIIYVLIPIAIIIVAVAIVIFFWAVKTNQFEDLDRQGYSILFDDDLSPEEKKLAEQRKQLQESKAMKNKEDNGRD
ncbi:cbb3-type cytochrome oxidase assembly protein CcoS [Alteromonas sp. IB21]|jgi:cbb3-type cytochrome oxidase maturation protein|uniref:Cbb3-type cytochrome oxidase assembly protein CcoS n=1 Tax=Alteromonas gracilis TaxID=1479524 RepID=A0ABX5CNJ7_9ALTE|nr:MULTISPECIES: cbb3-type cytochrome oxidase assembly protein CcoS [Alteromonas]MBJ2128365.1 cbb3-type cytochrome oxidase assembly protein CcoS [Alteromonas sp. IB21]PRO69144.1 cbb3-type cytochrome oxidase assembly protein CcoS [Alteromonas gracilis]|tara:strand:+ start:248 stop:478 length:231 start_codon:yes stop_codon:yes gene_type:complete